MSPFLPRRKRRSFPVSEFGALIGGKRPLRAPAVAGQKKMPPSCVKRREWSIRAAGAEKAVTEQVQACDPLPTRLLTHLRALGGDKGDLRTPGSGKIDALRPANQRPIDG